MSELLNLNFLVSDPTSGARMKYAMPFLGSNLKISDVCRLLWENNQHSPSKTVTNTPSLATKADDYGIFLYDTSGKTAKGHWLSPDKTLADYGLTSENVMEFKTKKRVLKIRLQDQSEKTVIIDQSLPVQLLLPLVCEKMGIANHEEFDFALISDDALADQVDSAVPAKKTGLTALVDPSNFSPATLDKRKMIRLKKKLGATEDDVAWVNQSQTLEEQGVDEKDLLLLRRRYFYTDRNVDARDPVQLNLLYVQCRNAILSGMHPVTLEEALQFAGLQGQIEFQNFTEAKHGLDIRAFLPRNFNDGKKLTKRQLEDYQAIIQLEWQAHKGATELDVKDLYIKMARSLKTYGMTFFLVKEKMKGRNKLIPRLFGVTRSAVLRLDEKTKETLESRPIATIQQWAVTDNTFNLNFGDYYDDRFSFQTKEGKQIAQLISGYAELIKKRQRFDSDNQNDVTSSSAENDSELPTYESIAAAECKYVHTGNFLENLQRVQSGHVALPGVIRNTNADRHDVHYIDTAQARVAQIIANFAVAYQLPQSTFAQTGQTSGSDSSKATEQEYTMEDHQTAFCTSMGQVSFGVAQMLSISRSNSDAQTGDENAPAKSNQEKVIFDLIKNLEDLAGSLRQMRGSLNAEQSSNLMMSGEAFCQSFSDLLAATEPAGRTEGSVEARQGLLMAVSKLGETGRHLADSVFSLDGQMSPRLAAKNKSFGWTDQEYIVHINAIGVGAGDLARKAKMLAAEVQDPDQQKVIIRKATELALQSAETIASTKLLCLCPKDNPDVTTKTINQLSLALDALQQALDSLQTVCLRDLQLADSARHFVIEIDQGVTSLSDTLTNFKRDLSASIRKTQNEAAINELCSLQNQIRELDGIMEENTVHNSSGSWDEDCDCYKKLRTEANKLKVCLTTKNQPLSEDVTEFSRHCSIDQLLDLLRSLILEILAINQSGKWRSQGERREVLNHWQKLFRNVCVHIHFYSELDFSQTAAPLTDDKNGRDAAIQAVDEFMAVLTTGQENKHDNTDPVQAEIAKIAACFGTTLQSLLLSQTDQKNHLTEGDSLVTKCSLDRDQWIGDYQHAFFTCMGNVSAAVVHLVDTSRGRTADEKNPQNESVKDHRDRVIFDLLKDLDELVHSLCEIAHFISPEQSVDLLAAGQAFCHCFSDLQAATDPTGKTTGGAEARQGVLVAVSKIGETGRHLSELISCLHSQDPAKNHLPTPISQDLMGRHIKQIGSGATDLIRKTRILAADVGDFNQRNLIIHSSAELALQSAELIASTKLLRLFPTNKPDFTKKTSSQLLLTLDALQQALETLQAVCQGHFQFNDTPQSNVFEIDEGVIALSDVLETFKGSLLALTMDNQNDIVLKALRLLDDQMKEMDQVMMRSKPEQGSDGENKSSDTGSTAEVFYKKIQSDTDDLRQFLTTTCDAIPSQTKSGSHSKLDQLLDLLQSLIRDTLATSAAGEWETEEERVTVLNYLKTVYETAHEYISQTGAHEAICQTGRLPDQSSENALLKDAFLEALAEFSAVLTSMQETREILTISLTDINTSLAQVDGDLQQEYAEVLSSESTAGPNTTANALFCLESISEALIELTSLLKNVSPEVSYDTGALRELASAVCASYRTACDNWAVFHALASNLVDEASKMNIHRGLVELGHSCTKMMQTAAISSSDPTASAFPAACKDVLDKISHLQLYLNTLNCGTQSCGRALSTIEEVAEDLETAILFASAGTASLNTPTTPTAAQFPNIPPPKHSEADFQQIFVHLQATLGRFGDMQTQQDLAAVVEDTLRSTVQMVDIVRSSTAYLAHETSDAHVVALRKLKRVAMTIAATIRLAKISFGKGYLRKDGNSKEELVAASAAASAQLETLLQVLLDVQKPAHCRGEQLLQTVAKELALELKTLDKSTNLDGELLSTQLVVANVNRLTTTISKIEAALQSRKQEDFLKVANFVSQISADVFFANQANDNSHNQVRAVTDANANANSRPSSGRKCATSFADYLQVLAENLGSEDPVQVRERLEKARSGFYERVKQFEASQSKNSGVADLLRSQSSDENEAQKATDILNKSLSEAAAKIDGAARKLSRVQARRTIYLPTDIPVADFDCAADFCDPLFEFDQSLLDACKAIMHASANLIPAAGKAQEELVRFGRVTQRSAGHYSEDGQWSQGFISAARAIGGACQTLCDAANALMLGHATEEKLISAAKQVASFTAQLLLACQVRGDVNSPTMKKLLLAGNTVRRSTDQLVQIFIKHHQDSPTWQTGRKSPSRPLVDVAVNNKLVGGIAQEIKANEQVLKREQELVDAQKHLLQCRKAKYSDRHAEPLTTGSHSVSTRDMDELLAQERVLIKERELQEARANLLALRQLKYGVNPSDDEYSGYGVTVTGTSKRKNIAN